MMNVAAHPRYENYRDTGVEWLGTVPSAWTITRLGTVFTERRTKVSDKDYEPLSVTKNGILQQLDSAAKTNDGDNRKLVKKGDFVINSRSDRKGSSGVSRLDGSVSLINIVLQPKGIHPDFCNYVLKSYAFVEEYYRMGHGIVADLWTTRYDEMRGIQMALPSHDEQRAIAAFLDDKCAKIYGAVKIKEDQIALLRERRQIIIQDAVTRGLNPATQMKDSCIDWIGQIPAHWDVQRAKWLFKRMDRSVRPEDEIVTCFRDGEVTLRSNRRTDGFTTALKEIGYQGIRKGDLVIHAMDAFAGAIGVSDSDGKATPVYSACIPRQPNTADPTFYAYYMRHLALSGFLVSLAKGIRERSTDFRFNDFAELEVPFPSLPEQRAIVAHIDNASQKIKDGIAIKERQIAALKEYKTSLVNAAVTGKIRVI